MDNQDLAKRTLSVDGRSYDPRFKGIESAINEEQGSAVIPASDPKTGRGLLECVWKPIYLNAQDDAFDSFHHKVNCKSCSNGFYSTGNNGSTRHHSCPIYMPSGEVRN